MGIVTLYLSVIVLLPLAAVFAKAGEHGLSAAWDVITSKEALATLELTLVVSLVVTAINAVIGTAPINTSWPAVRSSTTTRVDRPTSPASRPCRRARSTSPSTPPGRTELRNTAR